MVAGGDACRLAASPGVGGASPPHEMPVNVILDLDGPGERGRAVVRNLDLEVALPVGKVVAGERAELLLDLEIGRLRLRRRGWRWHGALAVDRQGAPRAALLRRAGRVGEGEAVARAQRRCLALAAEPNVL